ncbi:arylesterase [Aromatoleum bremense]|uniref:Arylesterase n=1 Tax=Aromatoleum bremense TaxID=76115 RepID=A0ABX1NZT0_9RHOO|nr:arylesterase [Aromatoleum bremense]NMG17071.1 arylesterase [Aromatoleum bremense]QTQ33489.1 SGNH hydrolase-type esterase domain-containing protein [Aromatoleum bremense]
MLLRSIVIFFFAIMVSGAAQAATILVWGDSLSAGYGLRPKQDWPTLLQTRLEREGFRHTVINGSVSGETSSGGRSRLPAALDRHAPDLLIIELGANDGLRGLPPRLLAENLAAMIEVARSRGARVLLVGMQMPPNYGPAYTRRFEQTFAEVARKHKVPLVPFLLDGFADRHELFQSDGIHPTAEAQELIVDTVWKQLVSMLKG